MNELFHVKRPPYWISREQQCAVFKWLQKVFFSLISRQITSSLVLKRMIYIALLLWSLRNDNGDGYENVQGCAQGKLKGAKCFETVKFRLPSIWFVWKKKELLVSRRQKLGARGHWGLLEHSLDSISFNSSNVDSILWGWILKDRIEVQEKKNKVVVFCSRLPPWRYFQVVVVQRRQGNSCPMLVRGTNRNSG